MEHPQFEAGSRFFMYNDLAYRQDHAPVQSQHTAVGHAVRATYLYSAMTDIATLLQNGLGNTVRALFGDVTAKKIYLTGGLGSEGRTEAFAADYVLPNRAYAETCASIGGILWYHRLFLRQGDSAPYDVLERTLYNGYLSGVSLAGNTFFYQNPLVSDGKVERSAYFDVACCPANLSRLMAQLPGLIYAQRENTLYVNLFIGSDADVRVAGVPIKVAQQTEYPWKGGITISITPERQVDLTLAVRIPGWARGEAMPTALYRFADRTTEKVTVSLNGRVVSAVMRDGYATIQRRWQKDDVVTLALPMPIHRVLANEQVAENRGRAALQRGPIVYCLEAADNGGAVHDVRLPLDTKLAHTFRADLLNGVEVITGKGGDRTITAVPYFAWNNRGRGEMVVWVPY